LDIALEFRIGVLAAEFGSEGSVRLVGFTFALVFTKLIFGCCFRSIKSTKSLKSGVVILISKSSSVFLPESLPYCLKGTGTILLSFPKNYFDLF
jgi:hypothetical protein